jgi:alkanesulfonate monooxygenase SsuD/methylene tetrahydromethanopterin reductase-like flavin-dependent oxidoreductase (luciferase family)
MRFGVYLPTFAGPQLGFDQAALVKDFARKAEDLGFDALWVAEHFLERPGSHRVDVTAPLPGPRRQRHHAHPPATGLLILPYYHQSCWREIEPSGTHRAGASSSESDRAGTSTSSRRSATLAGAAGGLTRCSRPSAAC